MFVYQFHYVVNSRIPDSVLRQEVDLDDRLQKMDNT